jgi:hypothetical protein
MVHLHAVGLPSVAGRLRQLLQDLLNLFRQSGAAGYIVKPFTKPTLDSAIGRAGRTS